MNPFAVITGASSGIGAEFARRLAQRGYDLLLIARRRERLQKLAASLTSEHGVHAEPMAVDLSSQAELEQLASRLAGQTVEILVNGAGFGTEALFFEADI